MKSLYDLAEEAIQHVFEEDGISLEEVLENLRSLRYRLDELIDATEGDIDSD